MGQAKSPLQPKERRVENVHEVVLGFGKKQNLEESRRCPQCAEPTCIKGSPPVTSGCPLGIDIPGFIRFLREDDSTLALERIRRDNPFPAICGRICPAPCEQSCLFYEEGSPIAIRSLERYAADFGKSRPRKEKNSTPSKDKKIAIIGSGPAGMTAASYFIREGYGVTIFEAMNEAGGLLRYGIPEFRLPQKVLNEQIEELMASGVRIETNVLAGATLSMAEIFAQGHTVLLLTVGAGIPEFAEIPGHNLGGVYYAEEFLLRAQLGSKTRSIENTGLMQGHKTAVLGSGPSALDAARLAIRLGQGVDLIFGGLEEQLGVHVDDLRMAIEEGVKLHVPVDPLAIDEDEHGYAKGVNCCRLDAIEGNGKLRLEPVSNGQLFIEAQTVILSHGRRPNSFMRQHLPQLKWNEDGTLWVDPQTGLTSVENVFAAGNVATGAGSVVDAIAGGKAAAFKIMEFLSQ